MNNISSWLTLHPVFKNNYCLVETWWKRTSSLLFFRVKYTAMDSLMTYCKRPTETPGSLQQMINQHTYSAYTHCKTLLVIKPMDIQYKLWKSPLIISTTNCLTNGSDRCVKYLPFNLFSSIDVSILYMDYLKCHLPDYYTSVSLLIYPN